MAAATPRQIDANRRNAGQSTGPLTDAGKAASRRNALVHGLAGAGVVLAPDEAVEVERRCAEWAAVLAPADVVEAFHVRQYAVESVRVERCQAQERELMDRRARRACDPIAWDDDRRLDAEDLGARLARDPARIARRLRQTAQGCDWLIDGWRGLRAALDAGQPWDDTRRALALDLLGTPRDRRVGPSPADPAAGDDPAAPQRALAAGRIAELQRLRDDVLIDRDDDERAAAIAGAEEGGGSIERTLRLVRRYEAACQRRLRRSMDALLAPRAARLGRPASDHFAPETKAAATPATASPAPAPAPASPAPPAAARPPGPAPAPQPVPAPPVSVNTPAPSMVAAADRPRGNRRWRRAQARLARNGDAA